MHRKKLKTTGIDIVYIPRMDNVKHSFIKNAFHNSEIKNPGNPEHLAGIFAAKEAFFKCLGVKPRWLEIEITKEESGRPFVKLNEKLKREYHLKEENIDISISHDGDYAIAIAVVKV